jgi:DNA ligase 1
MVDIMGNIMDIRSTKETRMSNTWPILYRRTTNGKIISWEVWVEDDTIFTRYGYVGSEDLQTTSKKATYKCYGQSNARNPSQQAIFEAQAMWDKRADLKYSTSTESAQEANPILPMLAHKFEDHKHKINWKHGVLVQPKLDGCRALAYRDENDNIVMTTRQGKKWETLPHIVRALEEILPVGSTDVLDGELYLHGVTFQSVTRLVKKHRPESKDIQYCVYDVITDKAITQSERNVYLTTMLAMLQSNSLVKDVVVYVPTYIALSEKDVYDYQKDFVSAGYEGAIVRIPDALYKMNGRSNELLKVKSFDEDDFEIVGYNEGVGKFAGCVIWRCITKEGKTFDCVPKGTLEDKREWYDNAESYIGKMLSVKYFGLSEDKIPRFGVGLGIKEDR